MMVCVVLLILLHCTASTVVSQTTPVSLYMKATTADNVLIVSPSPANCTRYHEPCHTLSEYAHDIDKYVSDNTKFVFLPGTHYLDTGFRVSNVSSLVLLGDISSLPKLSSRVVCNSSAAMVAITGVSQLFISTLEVTSCGENVSVSIEEADRFILTFFHLFNSKPLHIYKSTSLLVDTNFTNNTGTDCGGSVWIGYSNVTLNGTNSFAHGHASELGGGMCVNGSTLTVVGNSTFTKNVAQEGGGAIFMSRSALNLMSESSVVFSRNTAEIEKSVHVYGTGGAVYIYHASIISLMPDSSMVFTGNTAGNNGGALCMAQSSMMLKSAARILFTNNSAGVSKGYGFGGAIATHYSTINMSNATLEFTGNTVNHLKLESGGGAVSVEFSTFNLVSNSSMKFTANKGNIGGAIVATNLSINLMSNSIVVFAGNVADSPEGTWTGISGGAINLLWSTISLMPGTSIEFTGNIAVSKDAKGGAVFLDNSTFNLMSSTSIVFTGNRANGTGGAIYVKDEFFSLYCLPDSDRLSRNLDKCFFQVPEDYSDIHLVFDSNSAAVGSDIYGGMIDRCLLPHQNTTNSTTVFNAIADNYSKLRISSPPYQLCHCNESTNDCLNYIVDHTVYPGETINIPVLTMGQRQGPSPAMVTVFSDPNFPTVQSSVLPDKWPKTSLSCSMLKYNVTSTDLKDAVYDLAVDICGTDSFKPMLLNIHFNNCQAFFELTSGTCKCAHAIQPYTVDSVISNQSIAREGTTWIGYDNKSHNYIAHLHCPSNYCNSERVYLNYSDIDKQCNTNHNRKGLLCGECRTNYSLMLGTSHCGKCFDYNLFLLLFFAFAGAALVVLLLVLRLTVAEGTINGLILFVNIFYVRRCQFLGTRNGCFPLNVFLAWLNLDFGIESCLYDGMDTYQNTWLQFLFPLYIWVLIGLVILSSRYSSWMTRKLGSNPVAVLATLVLLSYNKILQTIITVFSPTQLMYYNSTYENPTPTMHLMWLYDAKIPFLEGRHIPLFLIALLFLIFFILPYTLLLVFGQCLQAKSNLKIFSWVNRPTFKYFLDNYHAPYQNSHRYWTGLMLLVRIMLLIAFACDIPNDPSQYMLAIITVVVCVQSWWLILGVSGVYKRQWVGILDATFILNLIIVSAATSYCYGQQWCADGRQSVIGYTSLGVAFLTFIGILTYHFHMQVKGTAFGKKMCGCCKKSEEENEVLINND